jgi:hypothetical protein
VGGVTTPNLLEVAKRILPHLREAAEPYVGYGFFPGGDPRNFSPDPDCSEPEERANWERDCKLFEENGQPQSAAGQWVSENMHITFGKYGLGSYTIPNPEMEQLLTALKSAIAEAEGQVES